MTSTENFTEIVPDEPIRWGLNATGVGKCSDFGPVEGYVSETVQDLFKINMTKGAQRHLHATESTDMHIKVIHKVRSTAT